MAGDSTTRWMPGWQRILIVLAFALIGGGARGAGGVVGTVLATLCALICAAALGLVELAMALWYRGRRALQRSG